MNWKEYDLRYRQALETVCLVRFQGAVSSQLFAEFPKNLPGAFGKSLAREWEEMLHAYSQLEKSHPDLGRGHTGVETPSELPKRTQEKSTTKKTRTGEPVSLLLFTVPLALANPNRSASGFKALGERARLQAPNQQIIAVTAILDGFLNDTWRAILRRKPQALRSEKQIRVDEVLAAKSWNRLLDHLIEEAVHDFGWKSSRERIEFLMERCRISESISERDLDSIDRFQQYRHLIVHNGGRFSPEFNRRRPQDAKRIGTSISVKEDDLQRFFFSVLCVLSEIYVHTAKKYYKRTEEQVLGIRFRSGPAPT